jgi:hypothetical protein
VERLDRLETGPSEAKAGATGPSGATGPEESGPSGPTGPTGTTETCEEISIDETNNQFEVFVNATGYSTTYTITIPTAFYTYVGLAATLQEYIISASEQYGTGTLVIFDGTFFQILINGTGYDEESTAGFQVSSNTVLPTLGYTGETYTSLSEEVASFVIADEPVESNCPIDAGPSGPSGPEAPPAPNLIYTTLILGNDGTLYGIPTNWEPGDDFINLSETNAGVPEDINNVFSI